MRPRSWGEKMPSSISGFLTTESARRQVYASAYPRVMATRTRKRCRRYSASMRAPSVIGDAAGPAAKAASRDFTSRPGRRGRKVETEFPFCVNLEHSFHFVQTARIADDLPCLADRPDRSSGGLFAEGAGTWGRTRDGERCLGWGDRPDCRGRGQWR